jgi:peptide/nickel transport system permease protein
MGRDVVVGQVTEPSSGLRKHRLPRLLRRLLESRPGLMGAIIVLAVIATALLAPWLAPYSPERIDIMNRLQPPAFAPGGSTDHLLGTDAIGRDILSRIIYGSRVSLLVGLMAVSLGATVGIFLGLVGGYYSGFVDSFLSWLINVQLSFPFILLAIFVIAGFGGGLHVLVIVLAIGAWVRYARIMRGQVLSVKQKDYVEAAQAMGAPTFRVLLKHILPNAIAPMIVVASFTMSETILAEAALSFLGLGVSPEIPTWGGMLNDGRAYIQDAWWIAALPGVAIMTTVLGINLFGDWIRDYLDPNLDI